MANHFLFLFLFLITTSIGFSSNFASANLDNDGDGVPNESDLCPNLLEDYDSQYGNVIDGCPADFVPWFDADLDAIPDHLDNCPTVKETYNKFQDDDGCPDIIPEQQRRLS